MSKMTLSGKLPWWFDGYIYALALFCFIFKMSPDSEKLYSMIKRHITFKVEDQ